MRDAACIEFHPEVEFFPTQGQSHAPARAVCAGCLVKPDCLAYALRQGDIEGIWGGTSQGARKKMLDPNRPRKTYTKGAVFRGRGLS